jgi:hypothetical protein
MKLDSKVDLEIMRWLAWGHVGGGVLTNWLALPMADYENPMLSFLRRAEYPKLSRIQSLNNGVFFGQHSAVEDAIKKVLANPLLKNVTENKDQLTQLARKEGGAVVNLLGKNDIAVDKKADGVAYYTTDTISSKYGTVNDKLTNTTQAEGLDLLANLINSHLHLTFQEQHPEGVAIAKPLPEHTTALMLEATEIARNLTQCPTSPMPKSCPPNRSKCKPCDYKKGMKLQQFPTFVNTTKFFTIGTVRKSTAKDKTESYRLVQFKELVAAAPAHTLWLTAERVTQHDLDWIFGFDLPQVASANEEPTSPNDKSELIIFPRSKPPKPIEGQEVPDEIWIQKEDYRLRLARDALKSKEKRQVALVKAVEDWSLADTEAWRFARAFSARRRMERKKWEEDERKFAGTEKKAGERHGTGGGRWLDRS